MKIDDLSILTPMSLGGCCDLYIYQFIGYSGYDVNPELVLTTNQTECETCFDVCPLEKNECIPDCAVPTLDFTCESLGIIGCPSEC